MSKTAEILSIGTELLLGNIANTDAQDISQGLSELGINVFFHSVVGDNPERIKSAVEIAKSRADIIITTGGLGPTFDDITKETVAACFGKKLVVHEPSMEKIKSYFNSRPNVKITENNFRQAWLPEGCTVLENDWGTAPGVAFEANGQYVIMIPGPPRECRPMFKYRAMPYLAALSDSVLVSRNVRVFGMGESQMEATLYDMISTYTNPTVAPYAKDGECMLRVTAKAKSREEAFAMTEPVVEEIKRILKDVVYGVDVESLEEVVSNLLRERGMTISTAESCTGGLLSARITSLPGSSDIFKGSVCSYANEIKVKVLGVPAEDIKKYGAVSEPVARAMAENVRKLMETDIGVSITGVAGPAESEAKPVGTAFIGVSSEKGTNVIGVNLGRGDRAKVRTAAGHRALETVRRHILGIKD